MDISAIKTGLDVYISNNISVITPGTELQLPNWELQKDTLTKWVRVGYQGLLPEHSGRMLNPAETANVDAVSLQFLIIADCFVKIPITDKGLLWRIAEAAQSLLQRANIAIKEDAADVGSDTITWVRCGMARVDAIDPPTDIEHTTDQLQVTVEAVATVAG